MRKEGKMFFKKVKCIVCGIEWEKPCSSPIPAELDKIFPISSTVCRRCHVAVVQERQRKQKNFDCFGKAVNYCDQTGCKYREPCLKPEYAPKRA